MIREEAKCHCFSKAELRNIRLNDLSMDNSVCIELKAWDAEQRRDRNNGCGAWGGRQTLWSPIIATVGVSYHLARTCLPELTINVTLLPFTVGWTAIRQGTLIRQYLHWNLNPQTLDSTTWTIKGRHSQLLQIGYGFRTRHQGVLHWRSYHFQEDFFEM